MNNPTSNDGDWDVVDEAAFESFPASDPPGWGSCHASTVAASRPDAPSVGPHILEEDPAGMRYLVVYASGHPRTRWIAEAIGEQVRRLGHVAELADVSSSGMPHPADYDAAIVAISVGVHVDRAVVRWLYQAREGLAEIPTALFIVGHAWSVPHAIVHLRDTGLRPALIAAASHDVRRHWFARVAHHSLDADDAAQVAARFVTLVESHLTA